MVANGDDGRELTGAVSSGGAESDELGAWASGEVEQVHAREHTTVRSANGGTYRVHPVLVRTSIGVRVNRRPGQLDKLPVLVG